MRSNGLMALALVVVFLGLSAATATAAVVVEGNTVTFTLEAPDARSVFLAGTFNDWSTSRTPMEDPDGDGIWTVTLHLADGRYEYKFVIDGSIWLEDPQGIDRVDDRHGGFNSVVYVGEWQSATQVDLSAEWIGKMEQVGRGSSFNVYNDLIITVDGRAHPNLDAYGKFKIYQGFTPAEQVEELDWAPNWAGLEEASATLRLGPLSLVGSWKVHAGDSGDPWSLFQANADEDDFWGNDGYYRTEALLRAGDLDGRIGFIRGQDRVIFGRATHPLGGLTLGVIGTHHRWEDTTREDGEDHRTVYGLYATGDVTDHLGLTAQWLHARGTRLAASEGAPSTVTWIMPRYPHAYQVTIKGSWDGWAAETPLTRDPATGYWSVTLTLEPGAYEYVYHVQDPSGDFWINDGNGGNMVRVAQSVTESFAIENVPAGVTEVYLRGEMPGVGWERGIPMSPTSDGLWIATVNGLVPGAWYLWKVAYIKDGTEHWIGTGDSGVNFRRTVGSGLVEEGAAGDAGWVELRYRLAPWGLTLGSKVATEGFLAEFSDIGSDFQEHYVTASRELGPGLEAELGYSLRTAFVPTEASRTHTVTPALVFEGATPWLESARVAYAYKTGAEPDDELTLEASLRPAGGLTLDAEGKVRQDGFWSAEVTLEGALTGTLEATYEDDPEQGVTASASLERALFRGLSGEVEYSVEPGQEENWHLEVTQALPFATSSELSVAYDTAEEKLVLQLETAF